MSDEPLPVRTQDGTAEELHHPPPEAGGALVVQRPSGAALVLGSTQSEADLVGIVELGAASATGLAVVRRRSGGGAVLLTAGGQLWIDVIIGRDDPRWDDRVDVAAHWVGEAWAAALSSLGVVGVEVHRGRHEPGAHGRLVCFAGTGPGEVVVAGRKLVGISQRRTRDLARFQTTAYLGHAGAGAGRAALAAALVPAPSHPAAAVLFDPPALPALLTAATVTDRLAAIVNE